MAIIYALLVTFWDYSSVQVGSTRAGNQCSALHGLENTHVVHRFSSIHFGLPGGVSSSRHDNDTPSGLI
jgi:hypothetical protein